MIIDSHVHLSPAVDYADGGASLLQAMSDAGIDRMIASDLGTGWEQFPDSATVRAANDRMRAMAARLAPRLQYLVYLNVQNPDWESELERHRTTAIGIKLWISVKTPGTGALDNARALLRRAAALTLPVLIHVFHRTDARLPGEIGLDEFGMLAREFPECTLIGAHAGGNWREALGRLAELPENVYYDICGSYPERHMVSALVRDAGAHRLLFGSDAPGRSFASQLAKVFYAGLTAEEQELILWRNAAGIYRLPPPATPSAVRRARHFPLPEWGEDHFCFCGSWPFAESAVTVEALAALLAANQIRRAFTCHLSDIFQTDLPQRNRLFAQSCAAYSAIAPLAIVDPRRFEARRQLDGLGAFAGVWLSPYLHNYELDHPAVTAFAAECVRRRVRIWLNTALSDYRFRPASLAACVVAPEKLYAFMHRFPELSVTVQGWAELKTAVAQAPESWRFELSKLGDGERNPAELYAGGHGDRLVWGSEYPFRDYPEVRFALTHELSLLTVGR